MIGQREGGDLKYANVINYGNRDSSNYQFSWGVSEEEAKSADGMLKKNYKKRTNKNGDVKYEFTFGWASGKFSKIDIRDTQFGKQLSFSLTYEEEGEKKILVFNIPLYNQNGSMSFLAGSFGDQIGLIDFSKEVTVSLTKRGTLAFEQGGVYIPNTNDNEAFKKHVAAKPEPTEEEQIDGSKKWNFKAPSKWQYTQIISSQQRLVALGVGEVEEAAPVGVEQEAEDSLPF